MATRTLNAVDLSYRGRRASIGFGRGGPEVRGFRSTPGATDATPHALGEMDYGPTSAIDPGSWDRFFHKRDFAPPVAQRTTPGGPSLAESQNPSPEWGIRPQTSAPAFKAPPPSNLAPIAPPDTAGMASTISRPYTAPRTSPDAIYQQAANAHANYLGIPGAQRTDNTITSPRYGTGSVRRAPQIPPASELASLSLFDPETLTNGY